MSIKKKTFKKKKIAFFTLYPPRAFSIVLVEKSHTPCTWLEFRSKRKNKLMVFFATVKYIEGVYHHFWTVDVKTQMGGYLLSKGLLTFQTLLLGKEEPLEVDNSWKNASPQISSSWKESTKYNPHYLVSI